MTMEWHSSSSWPPWPQPWRDLICLSPKGYEANAVSAIHFADEGKGLSVWQLHGDSGWDSAQELEH
jgi:hypothetical protein